MDFNLWQTLLTILIVFGPCARDGRVPGVCRAQGVRLHAGPRRPQPGWSVWPVASSRRRHQIRAEVEEFIPKNADLVLFIVAPCIAMMTAMLSFAVVPFGATGSAADTSFQFVIAPHVDIGILFIFAVSSLAVYGIILGGWASNNKYSMLGGLRSSAQIISYESPLGLSILGVVLITGSLNLEQIIWHQAEGGLFAWNIFYQPLAFLLFMISSFAECNRLPFDLPESEQELIGGYHTEYNAFKLAFLFH